MLECNGSREQSLCFAVAIRAVVDKKLYARELAGLSPIRVKRRKNITEKLSEVEEFIGSQAFDSYCGSTETADEIRNGMDDVPLERFLEVLEGIVYI